MAQKDLDTEVNLVAFISLLSVLICSLLLTAIWVQIGTMDVKQAVGGQSADKKEVVPTLWVNFSKSKALQFKLEDAPGKAKRMANIEIKANSAGVDYEAAEAHIASIKKQVPTLRTALIKPTANTVYEDIIQLMDRIKKTGLIDLGVSPL